ncbi:FAD-dependent monooxygenase [Crossiella sp. NPDC003009]
MENAEELLFDSVEQVKMDRWPQGRVVLVGDSAWCVTPCAGMGVSAGLAAAGLLGTMLERHPRALAAWEAKLRPSIEYYQQIGLEQQAFSTPTSRFQIGLRKMLTRWQKWPLAGRWLRAMWEDGKTSRMEEQDIARA